MGQARSCEAKRVGGPLLPSGATQLRPLRGRASSNRVTLPYLSMTEPSLDLDRLRPGLLKTIHILASCSSTESYWASVTLLSVSVASRMALIVVESILSITSARERDDIGVAGGLRNKRCKPP